MAQQKPASESEKRSTPILFYADGYKFPDAYHVTRFLAPDPIIVLEQDGEVVIVASPLEEGRARKESRAREVFGFDAFGAQEIGKTAETREELDAEIIKRFFASRGVGRVAFGPYFALGMAERLRGAGIEIVVDRLGEGRRRAQAGHRAEGWSARARWESVHRRAPARDRRIAAARAGLRLRGRDHRAGEAGC